MEEFTYFHPFYTKGSASETGLDVYNKMGRLLGQVQKTSRGRYVVLDPDDAEPIGKAPTLPGAVFAVLNAAGGVQPSEGPHMPTQEVPSGELWEAPKPEPA